MDLLDDVIAFIIEAGHATRKDQDIFKDYMPATPDECISIFEYSGGVPAMFTQMSVRSIQVNVRAKKGALAKTKSQAIYKALYSEDLLQQIGNRRCILSMRNAPFKMMVDDKQRHVHTFNMAITTTID